MVGAFVLREDSIQTPYEMKDMYAAYDNKLYINDFVPDEAFVLDERSWYVGAKRRRALPRSGISQSR